MKSLYQFIIKPLDQRYDNTKKINDKAFIVNTSIEDHKFVSKKAIVVSTPAAYKTKINIGDELYVHHNIFRRYYDMKGKEKNSSTFFKDDLYFAYYLSADKEQSHIGILKYGNNLLDDLKIKPGELVTFTPNSEFEFIVNNERLYCMKSNDIALTHEYEGNEKEYNPRWAKSS